MQIINSMDANVVSKKILIVDDEDNAAALLEKALSAAGYSTLTASTLDQAASLSSSHHFDLALVDQRFLLEKCVFDASAIRYIVMSTYVDEDTIRRIADKGALGVLVKPIIIKEVLAQIFVALQRAAEFKMLIEAAKNHATAIQRAVDSARLVNVAVGILMERMQRPRTEVYNLLVADARCRRKRLVDVSNDIICAREIDYRWSVRGETPSAPDRVAEPRGSVCKSTTRLPE